MPTHGALSKAGKVRSQTPKIESTTDTSGPGPLRKNRKLYFRRFIFQSDDRYRSFHRNRRKR
jgi:small subunit ribosomal protein S30e